MNSIQPAAHVRAVTGFRHSEAGAGSIVSSAWNRSLLWLLVRFLPIVVLTSLSVAPAHADGVSGTISNGQTVNGSISNAGSDIYTFNIPAGGRSFVVSVAETGAHNETFVPTITLTAPDRDVRWLGRPLFTILKKENAVEGTWSVKVAAKGRGKSTGGSYALTLVQVPGTVPASGGITVGALTPGAVQPGTNSRGKLDVWTFNGVAGHTQTLTIGKTAGEGFFPEVVVVSPTGGFLGGASCESCKQDFPIKADGQYTIVAWKGDAHDVEGTYTLSVNAKN